MNNIDWKKWAVFGGAVLIIGFIVRLIIVVIAFITVKHEVDTGFKAAQQQIASARAKQKVEGKKFVDQWQKNADQVTDSMTAQIEQMQKDQKVFDKKFNAFNKQVDTDLYSRAAERERERMILGTDGTSKKQGQSQ